MNVRLILLVVLVCKLLVVVAQPENDRVLFTVAGKPVMVSEFKYIYQKTNGSKADFSAASVNEYLDLYTKFKLKVQRAKDMRLDTLSNLRQELDGYRKQLASSYLTDKSSVDQLVNEAYTRMKQDVSISHILVKCDQYAPPADTLKAYTRAMEAYKKVKGGTAFDRVCEDMSDDASTKKSGGTVGYITGMMLPNLYEIENAAYTIPAGQVSAPIRSRLGYHVIRVNDVRPARGEVVMAHILIREGKNATDQEKADAKKRIDEVYSKLVAGEDFGNLAQKYSEDKTTAARGGMVDKFGINQYEASIEDAAFGLTTPNSYTKPVKSSMGWHIIKLLNRVEMPTLESIYGDLQGKVKNDSRMEVANHAMTERIKKEAGFVLNNDVKSKIYKSLDNTFVQNTWKLPAVTNDEVLFKMGGTEYKTSQYFSFAQRNRQLRIQKNPNQTNEMIGDEVLKKMIAQEALAYEESQLDKKYPEFKALMREYEEGVLLFEATKRVVWDRASEDTTGLETFFNGNRSKYLWGERALVSNYTINTTDPKIVAGIRAYAAKKAGSKVLAKYNKEGGSLISQEEALIERGKSPEIDVLAWKKGSMSEPVVGEEATSFFKIESIQPTTQKTLNEARGYAIADYQDELEKRWLDELRSTYKVDVNKDVLNSIIK